jgi:hypothetical protein
MPNPKISLFIIKLMASSNCDMLGKSGRSILLKHVCAFKKFLKFLLYSVLVIQNLDILPRLDSKIL